MSTPSPAGLGSDLQLAQAAGTVEAVLVDLEVSLELGHSFPVTHTSSPGQPYQAEQPFALVFVKGLFELGYQFRYPNFRKGYTAEIMRLEAAGQLNLESENREHP